jgi:hypothetical protein
MHIGLKLGKLEQPANHSKRASTAANAIGKQSFTPQTPIANSPLGVLTTHGILVD